MVAYTLALVFAVPAPEDGIDRSWLTLTGQRAAIEQLDDGSQITFGVTAQSRLPVPVEAVDIGILFTELPEHLDEVDPARLYAKGQGAHDDVGVVRQTKKVTLAPGKEAAITFVLAVDPSWPKPRIFRAHVLGYRLGEVQAPLIFDLFGTEQAADEVAAAQAFGLLDGPVAKKAARERWQTDTALVAALAAAVQAPIPEAPTQDETLVRVFAVLATGVVGGEVATAALTGLSEDPRLNAFDEPFQTILVARILATPLETPLAFAVPTAARVMADVIEAGQQDLRGWPDVPAAPRDLTDELESMPEAPPAERVSRWSYVWAAIPIGGAVIVLLVLFLRRRSEE